jgi:hypothetical protein
MPQRNADAYIYICSGGEIWCVCTVDLQSKADAVAGTGRDPEAKLSVASKCIHPIDSQYRTDRREARDLGISRARPHGAPGGFAPSPWPP